MVLKFHTLTVLYKQHGKFSNKNRKWHEVCIGFPKETCDTAWQTIPFIKAMAKVTVAIFSQNFLDLIKLFGLHLWSSRIIIVTS